MQVVATKKNNALTQHSKLQPPNPEEKKRGGQTVLSGQNWRRLEVCRQRGYYDCCSPGGTYPHALPYSGTPPPSLLLHNSTPARPRLLPNFFFVFCLTFFVFCFLLFCLTFLFFFASLFFLCVPCIMSCLSPWGRRTTVSAGSCGGSG